MTHLMNPTISVVIPLYNHKKYIASTIYSVLCQTYPAAEIIVIDDGSSDDGVRQVELLAETRPEIIVWKQPNRGAHNTINSGIGRATSDVICILNSDDLYHPERLDVVASAFRNDGDLAAVFTAMDFVDGQGNPTEFPWYEQALAFYQETGLWGASLVNGNFLVTTSNLAARRTVFEDIGLFGDYRYAHDLDFFLRMSRSDQNVRFLDQRLMSYRIHDTNTISEGHDRVKVEWAYITALHLFRLCQGRAEAIVDYAEILNRHGLLKAVLTTWAFMIGAPDTATDFRAFRRNQDQYSALVEALS